VLLDTHSSLDSGCGSVNGTVVVSWCKPHEEEPGLAR
jgi:hypothetical protein